MKANLMKWVFFVLFAIVATPMPAQQNEVERELVEQIKLRAENGDEIAQFYLGTLHGYGGMGTPTNLVESAKWIRKSAEGGYAKAQFCLGMCYEAGFGLAKSQSEAENGIAKRLTREMPRRNTRLAIAMRKAMAFRKTSLRQSGGFAQPRTKVTQRPKVP